MKNKRWLVAILIISLLAIAFFWSGNHQESATRINENSIETQAVTDNTASSQSTNTQQNDEKKETTNVPDTQEKTEKFTVENEKKGEEVIRKQEADSSQKLHNDAATKLAENKTEKIASDTGSKKDKYLTDPVPEGKPKPTEWQAATINKEKNLTCTLSVTCKTILDNMDKFNKDKLEVLPSDGIIYKARKVSFYEGESVFDVLLREMKKEKIHMEFEMTPIYNSNYIEGIHNLYEFDCGELSGWMYKVNGWFPNYGCSRYSLKDGDTVEWIYTCDLGRDIGGGMAVGGKEQ